MISVKGYYSKTLFECVLDYCLKQERIHAFFLYRSKKWEVISIVIMEMTHRNVHAVGPFVFLSFLGSQVRYIA